MATTTRKRKPVHKTAAAKPNQAAAAAGKQPARANRPGNNKDVQAARKQAVLSRVVNGTESIGDVAKDLGIQTGKAAFIKMQLLVENGTVPAIKAKNDADLVSKTVAARKKADQFSSWGWLSARTGVGEGTLKAKVAEADKSVVGSNVASARKSSRPTKTSATRTKATTGSKRTATRKAGTRNPS